MGGLPKGVISEVRSCSQKTSKDSPLPKRPNASCQDFARGNVFGGWQNLTEANQHMQDGFNHLSGGRGWTQEDPLRNARGRKRADHDERIVMASA
jgi:hypothetical protein